MAKRLPRHGVAGFLVLLVASLMAGCGDLTGHEIAASEVVGHWVSDRGGEITFAEDGTFQATDLLGAVLGEFNPTGENFDGSGTWTASASRFGSCIQLKFNHLFDRTLSIPIYCSNSSSGRIHFIIGDPDSGDFYFFKKDRQ